MGSNIVLLMSFTVLSASASGYYNNKVSSLAHIENDFERFQKQQKACQIAGFWTAIAGLTVLIQLGLLFGDR